MHDFFLNTVKDLKIKTVIVVVCCCSQSELVQGLILGSYQILAGGSGKEVEMRVMRVGRTIDRAVWLAKRGGECQKFDPEIMAGIHPCKFGIRAITFRSARSLCSS